MDEEIRVTVCSEEHLELIPQVIDLIDAANREPGTAVARRTDSELRSKITAGAAAIALVGERTVVGFVFVSPWQEGAFVSTSGLVVAKQYRGRGIARRLKEASLLIINRLYPGATPFGITLSGTVMQLNADCGFIPVSYDAITTDDAFWKGCESCQFFGTLKAMERKRCFCTAMILPKKPAKKPL